MLGRALHSCSCSVAAVAVQATNVDELGGVSFTELNFEKGTVEAKTIGEFRTFPLQTAARTWRQRFGGYHVRFIFFDGQALPLHSFIILHSVLLHQ